MHGVVPIDPTPRKGMAPEVAAAWNEIVADAGEYLAQSDRVAIELAAMLLVRVRRPASSSADAAQLASLLNKLGATPAGRRSLDTVREPADADPDDKFFID